jgi:hypothetical protein
MIWSVPKIWKDGTCWIIGGGCSVPSQFHIPKNIVRNVKSGKIPISAFSPYMELLHDKHVIAINGAFRLGDWVDMCFFGDKAWYFKNRSELLGYKGIVIGCPEFFKVQGWQKENVMYLEKSRELYGISKNPSQVCWNFNSGSAAISIAANAGCKRIILLGFDMNTTNGETHWHNLYNGATNPFAKHLRGFDKIAADAKERGIEIINASPNSAITQFQKMNVKDIEQ